MRDSVVDRNTGGERHALQRCFFLYQKRIRKKNLTFKNAPFVTRTPLTALL